MAVRLTALMALALAAGGCTALDNLLAKVPIFSFMVESPAFDPYEAPRPAPANAVPFSAPGGPLPAISPPAGPVTEQWLVSLADSLDNPVPVDTATLAAGQAAYQTHCFVCHGAEGRGNGPAVGPGRVPFALPLVGARAESLSDEYIYGIIWTGRGLMPAYGSRVPDRERWMIVNYVRQLQRAAAGGAGAAAQPAAPGAVSGGE